MVKKAAPTATPTPEPSLSEEQIGYGVIVGASLVVCLAVNLTGFVLKRLPGVLAPFRRKPKQHNAEKYQPFNSQPSTRTPVTPNLLQRFLQCREGMCPILPGAPMPTKPGVYWRDTAQWVEYSPQQSARIIDGYNALHQAEYAHMHTPSTRNLRSSAKSSKTAAAVAAGPGTPPPPKGIGGGVVLGGLTAETPRGKPQVSKGG
jgi:hypothetical protein